MKTASFAIQLLILFLFSCVENQKEQVPDEIKLVFEESHLDASDVLWTVKENGYEVDFNSKGREIEIEYDKDGQLIEEEVIIGEAALPESIHQYLDNNYPQLHIGEASIEEKNGEKVYELELLNGFFREIELEFDINGHLLRKETYKD